MLTPTSRAYESVFSQATRSCQSGLVLLDSAPHLLEEVLLQLPVGKLTHHQESLMTLRSAQAGVAEVMRQV